MEQAAAAVACVPSWEHRTAARRQRPELAHLRSTRRQHTPFIDSADFSGAITFTDTRCNLPLPQSRMVFPRKQMDPFHREIAPLTRPNRVLIHGHYALVSSGHCGLADINPF